jgi:molybdopterin synthase catalytic subunit
VPWLAPTEKSTGAIATFSGTIRGSTLCAERAKLRSRQRTAAMQVFNIGLSTDNSRALIVNFLWPKISAGFDIA